jgi:glutamate synthase (NADPH) large chain
VRPAKGSSFDPAQNTIAGNVLLYGATCGEAYLNGRVGERFAVRNSGAWAVVEGVGDHGCEYMTGGRVAILGPTGVNFAAGMSGGLAYVLDESGDFDARCNLEMVDLESLSIVDERELRGMIERHAALTGSPRAKEILADWRQWKDLFVKVLPMEYRFILGQMSRDDAETKREEKAKE